MTNRSTTPSKRASAYRGAAEAALHGLAYTYLSDNHRGDYYSLFSEVFDITWALQVFPAWSHKERSIALCLMAAMVEAGDA